MKKKCVSIVFSLLIISVLYYKININDLFDAISNSRIIFLFLALLMFIPTTYFSSLRFTMLTKSAGISIKTATRLFLIAQTLNLVLPSKMGDVFKVGFIQKNNNTSTSMYCLSIVEKIFDIIALSLWCIWGFVFSYEYSGFISIIGIIIIISCILLILIVVSTKFSKIVFTKLEYFTPVVVSRKIASVSTLWYEMQKYLFNNNKLVIHVFSLSLLLWLLHLTQIWFLMKALLFQVSFLTNTKLTPIAIYVGLLPISIAGIGTRDAAFVYLYSQYTTASASAALGLLCTLRYIIPAIAGLPLTLISLNTFKIKR